MRPSAVCLAMLWFAVAARADNADLHLELGALDRTGGTWPRNSIGDTFLAAGWDVGAADWGIRILGAVESRGGAAWMLTGEGSGSWSRRLYKTLGGRLQIRGGSRALPGYSRTGQWEGRGGFTCTGGRAEAWAEAGGGQAWNGSAWSGLARGVVGSGYRVGRVSITVTGRMTGFREPAGVPSTAASGDSVWGEWISDGVDPMSTAESGSRKEVRTYTDAELRFRWRGGPWELTGLTGYRVGYKGDGTRAWGNVRGTFWCSPRFAVVAAGGRVPAIPEEQLPDQTVGSLALRFDLTPAPVDHRRRAHPGRVTAEAPAFAVYRIRGDLHRFQLRLGKATEIELAGDFNDWQPVPLERTSPRFWQLREDLSPGVHRVSIRIDGAQWMAPPGLPPQKDEFGRSFGMFIVPG